jgi:hypothetical protein
MTQVKGLVARRGAGEYIKVIGIKTQINIHIMDSLSILV